MLHHPLRLAALSLLGLGACTFHSTASHWHQRTAPDGKPVFVTTTTAYGLNLGIVLPFLGDTRLDETVDRACEHIARSDSDGVRVVETESYNYWYAIPPFTWLFTPVVMSVSLEYTPSAKLLAETAAADAWRDQKALERREQDHSHLIPEPRR